MLSRVLKKYFTVSLSILCTFPSRIFFGNALSLNHNIAPMIDNWKFRHSSKREKSQIDEDGFKKISYNLDKNLIKIIHEKYNTLINDKNFYAETTNEKTRFIINPLKSIPEIKNLVDLFKEEIFKYYGTSFIIKQIRAFRNYTDESHTWDREKYVYSNFWHFDDYKSNKLKVFVLLNDNVNENTGSTKIVNKKNSKKLIRSFKFKHTSLVSKNFNEYLLNNNMVVYCNGDKGDVYIINTQKCLHAASIPTQSKYRDAICFEIYQDINSKSDIFNVEHDKHVQNLN